jgi:anhydro-N-acetylmuramic acid kinase
MRVLGMISGTSHDGIDIAVCDFHQEGDALVGRVELIDAVPYSATLREAIVAALPPLTTTADAVTRLDARIGREFAAAAATAIRAHEALGLGPVDAVCSHGQTVFHWVEGPVAEGTLQLGQPAWLAEATGLPVVSDVRSADVVAGGQGAPLVCVLDTLVLETLRAQGRTVAALNLGGISNVTVCAPDQDPVAWDIGTANALIDAAVSADPSTPLAFDRDGLIGRSGTVVPGLLDILLDEPYYRAPAPKSTGKELFHAAYLDEAVARHGTPVGLADLVATLVELAARTVADALIGRGVDEVFMSGGGVRNPTLLAAIAAASPATRFSTTATLGLDTDAKEAVAFALIGWATMHGLPGNVPSCTGARGPRVLGRVTPGVSGSLLPVWRGVAPTRLTLESAGRP